MDELQLQIRKRIKSDEIDKTVNVEKQNRHIRGTHEYVDERSYLLENVDPQELVDRYHSTGELDVSLDGHWKNKETIVADRIVGVNVNPNTKDEALTNIFKIHYSRTGTHIVPTLKRVILI